MSYYVDVGIVTDKEGFDTLMEHPAVKEMYEKGESSNSKLIVNGEEELYYITFDQVKDSYLISNGVFNLLNTLKRVETLVIGEDYNDIRHRNIWPDSMNDDPPFDYLYCNRTIEFSCDVKKVKEA